jgi:hypothetical protein
VWGWGRGDKGIKELREKRAKEFEYLGFAKVFEILVEKERSEFRTELQASPFRIQDIFMPEESRRGKRVERRSWQSSGH